MITSHLATRPVGINEYSKSVVRIARLIVANISRVFTYSGQVGYQLSTCNVHSEYSLRIGKETAIGYESRPFRYFPRMFELNGITNVIINRTRIGNAWIKRWDKGNLEGKTRGSWEIKTLVWKRLGVERGNVTKRDKIKREGCLKTAEEMERGPSSAEIGESKDKREMRDPPRRKGGGEQEAGNVEFWTLKENRKRRKHEVRTSTAVWK